MRYRRYVFFGFYLVVVVILTAPALAQTGLSASLSAPNTQNFPLVEAYLDVKDAAGRFFHNLRPDSLQVIEDGQALPVRELQLLRPGAQIVVALNPGPTFALRNSQGAARSSLIQRTLQDWASSRFGSTVDDLSLLITNGPEATHLKDPEQWSASLNRLEEIDVRQATPSLDTLARAVEIAADTPPRPGMSKAVLFITPPTEDQSEVGIQNIITRASEQGIQVFVWMVPVPGAYYPNAEKQFQQLISQTGGQLFTYTDEQPTLNLEDLFEPLRSVFRVAYDSKIRASGAHQFAVDIQQAAGAVTTPTQNFELKILPPEPAFVSPPLEILRTPPLGEDGKLVEDAPISDYLPAQQDIQILTAFPDERIRPLVRTSLYIDGNLVQENRRSPFDRFTWDLSELTASGAHMIRVEAEDDLGLVGTTIERLVQLTIELPVRSPWTWVFRNAPALSLLGAVIAGSILVLVLLLGGRLRPHQPGTPRKKRQKSDPVTQPVPVKAEAPSRRLGGFANRLHWPQRSIPPRAEAFLTRIRETDDDASSAPIPITTAEITFGSDPNLATLVLTDSSVEGLHARILCKDDSVYRIVDEGSIAGTWINYSPISREGANLENGDLVHIGRVGFRFSTRRPGQSRKAVVISAEPTQKNNL